MYLPIERSGIDLLDGARNISASHPDWPVYLLETIPGLVAREGTPVSFDHPKTSAIEDAFVDALIHLEEFDIAYPGISFIPVRSQSYPGEVDVYTVGHFVDGYNMRTEMDKVPTEALTSTFTNMVRYYTQMSFDYSDRLYLSDLCLENCLFGVPADASSPSTRVPQAHFIDYDIRRLSNIKNEHGLYASSKERIFRTAAWFQGIAKLDVELGLLKKHLPTINFDDEARLLTRLVAVDGLVLAAPNAQEHFNALKGRS